MSGQSNKVRVLAYCAICIAIAFMLGQVKLFRMPQGGSVTACRMLFIALTGYWFGSAWGTASGAAYGILSLILNPYAVHPIQFLLDYPAGYMALGAVAGVFRGRKLALGYILGVAARFVCVFISGAVFFGEYSPQGELLVLSSITNSLVYNASYMLPEAVITLVIMAIPPVRHAIDRIQPQ